MTAMVGNGPAPGQQMMYYYIVSQPQQAPDSAHRGDAMRDFEGQGFGASQQAPPVYYAGDPITDAGLSVGQMGAQYMGVNMVPADQGGLAVSGPVMMLAPAMQPQPALQMQQDTASYVQAGGRWQAPQQPPQPQQMGGQQAPVTPASGAEPRGARASAFKIVDPQTKEEIRGTGGVLPAAGGAVGATRSSVGGLGPAPGGGGVPLSESSSAAPAAAEQQPAAAADAAPVAPPAVGPKRKGLKNAKLVINDRTGAGGPAEIPSAQSSPPVLRPAAPSAEAASSESKLPNEPLAQSDAALAPSAEAVQAPSNAAAEMLIPKAGTEATATPSFSRWPPPPSALNNSNSGFASSIKALNLEPRRANPPQRVVKQLPKARPVASLSDVPQDSSVQGTATPNAALPLALPAATTAQATPTEQEYHSQQSQVLPQAQVQMPTPPQVHQVPPQVQVQPQVPMQTSQQATLAAPEVKQQSAPAPAAVAPAPPTKKKPLRISNAPFKPERPVSQEGDQGSDARQGDARRVEPEAQEADTTTSEPEPAQEATAPMVAAATAAEVEPASAPEEDRMELADSRAKKGVSDGGRDSGSQIPKDGVLDRNLMLRIWKFHRGEAHEAVQGLYCTVVRPGDHAPPKPTPSKPKPQPSKPKPKPKPQPLRPREDELARTARSLLNKITPTNLKTIVEHLAQIGIVTASDLESVIAIIFEQALNQPHYCETYADMVFALRWRFPEFPPENEAEKPQTFLRVLLNICQNEFENLPTSLEPTAEESNQMPAEDLRLFLKKRKDKVLANMKFIGNLFLRQLLSVKVIGQVVHDLIGIKEGLPEVHLIECACELLQAIGYTLDTTGQGRALMSQFSARLVDLKRLSMAKRIQCKIQDLLDLRDNQWQKKIFQEQAKTMDDVRKDAMKDARQHAKGGSIGVGFSTQTVGLRPAYIEELKAKPGIGPAAKAAEPLGKPNFDQAYVKRVLQYYEEEKSSDGLVSDWQKAQPSSKHNEQGLGWLLGIGFNDACKEDIVAETIVELVKKKCVTWENLRGAIAPCLDDIEELKIDVPQCDLFYHSLLARLLTMEAPFNQSFLKLLSTEKEITSSLLMGAMRRVKQLGGTSAVRKSLEYRELTKLIAESRRCRQNEVVKALQGEGIL